MKEYKIRFVNSLLDNVHGFIGLTEVENQIEQLPIFKRLQDISQLGLANRIFPCALHNRYTHSLGVMHIADQMAIHLELTEDERQVLRLAGLLHDIGHYPLSHDVESAYMECNAACYNRDNSERWGYFKEETQKHINKLSDSYVPKLLMRQADSEFHHEVIGTKVIRNSTKIKSIIKEFYVNENVYYEHIENAEDKIIDDICAIITGNAQHESAIFEKRLIILIQLMHSELDADRIDYLLRDSTFSGAAYGNFDVGQLIQNIKCCEYKNSFIVGVNKKGIGCAEQFLVNRYLAYSGYFS